MQLELYVTIYMEGYGYRQWFLQGKKNSAGSYLWSHNTWRSSGSNFTLETLQNKISHTILPDYNRLASLLA